MQIIKTWKELAFLVVEKSLVGVSRPNRKAPETYSGTDGGDSAHQQQN